jgi:hypothetical protein
MKVGRETNALIGLRREFDFEKKRLGCLKTQIRKECRVQARSGEADEQHAHWRVDAPAVTVLTPPER